MSRPTSREELTSPPVHLSRPYMTEAIAGYRSHTMQPPRYAREPAQNREQHRETREPRGHRELRAVHRETRELSSDSSSSPQLPPQRPRYLSTRPPSRDFPPSSSSSSSWSESGPPSRRRNPADFSSDSSPSGSPVSRSSAPSSSSSSSRSRSRSAQGVVAPEHSHLAPVTRDFLREKRARSSRDSGRGRNNDGDRRLEAVEGESFFPTPKVTFLIDEPRGLKCQICLTTTLEMAESAAEAEAEAEAHASTDAGADAEGKTSAPAILPCGHVACGPCMAQWLAAHRSCPFCRQEMRHAGCGHAVAPRPVAHDTVHALPRTTAEGGSVGHRCPDCRVGDLRADALRRWQGLADDLRRARRAADERGPGDRDAAAALKRAEKAFEAAPSRAMMDKVSRADASW